MTPPRPDPCALPASPLPDRAAAQDGPGEPAGDTPRRAFLDAMARVVASVTIVTTDGPAGRFGVTVSAMCSVSADPPLLLVCINRKSPSCRAVRANRAFAVSVLGTAQRHLAQTFAGRPTRGRPFDFAGASWHRGRSGAPILDGAVAAFDCRLLQAQEAGTHTIFVGEVLAASTSPGEPLLYGRRAYRCPAPLPE